MCPKTVSSWFGSFSFFIYKYINNLHGVTLSLNPLVDCIGSVVGVVGGRILIGRSTKVGAFSLGSVVGVDKGRFLIGRLGTDGDLNSTVFCGWPCDRVRLSLYHWAISLRSNTCLLHSKYCVVVEVGVDMISNLG